MNLGTRSHSGEIKVKAALKVRDEMLYYVQSIISSKGHLTGTFDELYHSKASLRNSPAGPAALASRPYIASLDLRGGLGQDTKIRAADSLVWPSIGR